MVCSPLGARFAFPALSYTSKLMRSGPATALSRLRSALQEKTSFGAGGIAVQAIFHSRGSTPCHDAVKFTRSMSGSFGCVGKAYAAKSTTLPTTCPFNGLIHSPPGLMCLKALKYALIPAKLISIAKTTSAPRATLRVCCEREVFCWGGRDLSNSDDVVFLCK